MIKRYKKNDIMGIILNMISLMKEESLCLIQKILIYLQKSIF